MYVTQVTSALCHHWDWLRCKLLGRKWLFVSQHSISECSLVALHHWSTHHTSRVKLWPVAAAVVWWRHCSNYSSSALHWGVTQAPCIRVLVAWHWPPALAVLARQAHTASRHIWSHRTGIMGGLQGLICPLVTACCWDTQEQGVCQSL
jgi:hypothetical protein